MVHDQKKKSSRKDRNVEKYVFSWECSTSYNFEVSACPLYYIFISLFILFTKLPLMVYLDMKANYSIPVWYVEFFLPLNLQDFQLTMTLRWIWTPLPEMSTFSGALKDLQKPFHSQCTSYRLWCEQSGHSLVSIKYLTWITVHMIE